MAKISVKSSGGWKGGGKFVLGVSLGSQNHEGEALEAIVDWINGTSFEGGIIDLSDTLNRYTDIMQGMDADKATLKALKEGDEWLRLNTRILARIDKPVEIVRWDQWRIDPRFPVVLEKIQHLTNERPQLWNAIGMDVANFYARRDMPCSTDNVMSSIRYFQEELTAHTLMHRDNELTSIYPGKQLECYKFVRSKSVEGFPEGIPGSAFVRLVPHSFDAAPVSSLRFG